MLTKYCGAECQKVHWKVHKRQCKLVRRKKPVADAQNDGGLLKYVLIAISADPVQKDGWMDGCPLSLFGSPQD
jgi:hypothetical protein